MTSQANPSTNPLNQIPGSTQLPAAAAEPAAQKHSLPSKVVILAGGLGTRISEETHLKPKPMVEIGGRPILWHILKIYSTFGINEFIICAGYKGYVIKEYFANYFMHMSDVTFDMNKNQMQVHTRNAEPWKVTVVDTGEDTMTGGRLARVRSFVGDQTFCFTYGDGVADINIPELVKFHHQQETLVTMTAVQPPGRYGAITFRDENPASVHHFQEKPAGDGAWINGGFFVLQPAAMDYIRDGGATVWEQSPLQSLAAEGQLSAYRHRGFWRPMDTLRDRNQLQEMWEQGRAPWRMWA